MLAAVALGSGVGCGAQRAASTAATTPAKAQKLAPAEVVREVKGAVEQYRQAYEVKSLDALAPLYLQGPGLELVIQGERTSGWDSVRNYLSARLSAATEIHARTSDVSVVALGNTAAAAVLTLFRSISDGTATLSVTGTLTLVFRRVGGDWKIASEHFSYPPKTP